MASAAERTWVLRIQSVKDGTATPRGKGNLSMFLDGRWHSLDFTGAPPEDASRAASLDVALLQHHVLAPLLNIGDVRTDKRIDFVGGARGTAALEKAEFVTTSTSPLR